MDDFNAAKKRSIAMLEKEMKELEVRVGEMKSVKSESQRLRGRLDTFRKATRHREEALVKEVEGRKESLEKVLKELEQLEADRQAAKDAPPVFPALHSAEPLGGALAAALKDKSFGAQARSVPRKAAETHEVDLEKPVAWPTLHSLGDLWLALAELEAGADWRENGRRLAAGGHGGFQSREPRDVWALVDELAAMSHPETLYAAHRENSMMQAMLETETAKKQTALARVIDQQAPLHSTMGTHEIKRVEILQRQANLISAIDAAEETWQAQKKEKLKGLSKYESSSDVEQRRPNSKKSYAIETPRLVEFFKQIGLHWTRFEEGNAKDPASKQKKGTPCFSAADPWKVLLERLKFTMVSQRRDCERLRKAAAGAQAAAERRETAPSAQLAVVDDRARAALKAVESKSAEALAALDVWAKWASSAEASLVLCALNEDQSTKWRPVAAAPPQPLAKDVARVREMVINLGTIVSQDIPDASRTVKGAKANATRQKQAEEVPQAVPQEVQVMKELLASEQH